MYGVPFEIYSDHRSLHYLFSQKNPSQRILRLCEFLSGFNFKEVQYVKGEHAAVPDFFSRSSALHALSRAGTVREGRSEHRVRVLPVCDGHVGLVQSVGTDGVIQRFLLSNLGGSKTLIRGVGREDCVGGVGWYRCSSATLALCISWSRWLEMASRLRRYGGHGSRVGSTGMRGSSPPATVCQSCQMCLSGAPSWTTLR